MAGLVLMFVASVASAAPQVTSITPNSGPVTGGTAVTIRGSDFRVCDTCSPAIVLVYFGDARGQFASLVNPSTIEVITPPHFAGFADVTVYLSNGTVTVPSGFLFTGNSEDVFERILLPIFTPPSNGAYGSEFVTTFSAVNTSNEAVPIAGLTRFCPIFCSISPVEVEPSDDANVGGAVEYSGSPGRFIYLRKSQADSLAMNLRVQDISREELNFGTEIPIVRWSEVRSGPLTLTGVPLDVRFRQALRIYSTEPTTVRVTVADITATITLAPATEFYPAYATFTDFSQPTPPGTLTNVVVEPLTPGVKIWAFVAVTNNETQAITTISPQ